MIKERYHRYCAKMGVKLVTVIEFGLVGKLSPAHSLAKKVGLGKTKISKEITVDEILKLVNEELKTDREPAAAGPRTT